jgi:hypothetical protein
MDEMILQSASMARVENSEPGGGKRIPPEWLSREGFATNPFTKRGVRA